MTNILKNMQNKIDLIQKQFKDINNYPNLLSKKLETLEKIEKFNNDLEILEISLLDLRTSLFENNLELLDYKEKKELIDHKINKIIEKVLYPYMILIKLNISNNIDLL